MFLRMTTLLAMMLLPYASIAQSSQCYSIKDADLKNECLAITKGNPSQCYSIKGKDLKNSCLARVKDQKSRCYSIKDKDQKYRCLSNFK
jgi:predicted nuclease of predicted toxin-antitoxin system